jgi:hypothetical protein
MDHLHSVGMFVSGEDYVGQGGGGFCETATEGHHAQHGETPRSSGPCGTTVENHGGSLVIWSSTRQSNGIGRSHAEDEEATKALASPSEANLGLG